MKNDNAELDSKSNSGYGNEVPPQLDHVKIIFCHQELEEKDVIEFFNHFHENGWKTKTGVPIKNWKQILDQWIWDMKTGVGKRNFSIKKRVS